MIIKTWRNPYDAGFTPTKPKEIDINSGLTVLVGCNGAGKTTLLHNIKDELKKQNIPCHLFDNLHDGGSNSWGSILSGYSDFDCDNLGLGATLFSSSEGESIKLNIGRQSTKYKEFLETGIFKSRFHNIFGDVKEEIKDIKRFLLFDATDSGMSIDSIIEIKTLFKELLEDAKNRNVELYIIISANEYELCRNENCFDVNEGQYLQFADYEDYRKFIITNRQKKEKRIDKQIKWCNRQEEKEKQQYIALKEKIDKQISEIKEKAEIEQRSLDWTEKHKISDYEHKLKDFERNCRFYSCEIG